MCQEAHKRALPTLLGGEKKHHVMRRFRMRRVPASGRDLGAAIVLHEAEQLFFGIGLAQVIVDTEFLARARCFSPTREVIMMIGILPKDAGRRDLRRHLVAVHARHFDVDSTTAGRLPRVAHGVHAIGRQRTR